MRSHFVALCACVLLINPTQASPPRYFDDAALHAIQFVDKDEGWAVGDEGVVWHSIDGGKNWERQPTGVQGSLRSLHFLNPYTGWIAGREELPNGNGSTGVLLFTRDGGIKWQRVHLNALPGLHEIRFLDSKIGFLAGAGSEAYPSGVFQTKDGGRTWQPVPGPRSPGWLSADFQPNGTGAFAGAWNSLAQVRKGNLALADIDTLGGRNLRCVRVQGKGAIAVGQGALVLLNQDMSDTTWTYLNLGLPTELRASWDFHAVHTAGNHIWIAGRPGSALLHSNNGGEKWETQSTGQPLPLNGLFFNNESSGWAVGELGSILHTADGGKTWRVQKRGGQRAALLFVHARSTGLPVDTLATLGAEEGYLAATLRVLASDPSSSPPERAGEAQRLTAATRQAGGAAAETLWQFPASEHLQNADKTEFLRAWNRLHSDRSADELLRQMVLALRIWRPEVVITDSPDTQKSLSSADALVAEAVHAAFQKAADPQAFPEQLSQLGLQPWKTNKLYSRWENKNGAHIICELNEVSPRLEGTVRQFAAPSAGLLAEAAVVLPNQRYFHLLDSRIEGAAGHHELMQGISLAHEGEARRPLSALAESSPEAVKALRERRNLEILAESPLNGLIDPNKLLAQIGPALAKLPDEQGAQAAFAVASQMARTGQWGLAREAFLLMVDRYPAHPLSADAYRWLIGHNSSTEARHRHEMGQFLLTSEIEFKRGDNAPELKIQPAQPPSSKEDGKASPKKMTKIDVQDANVEVQTTGKLAMLASLSETRRWYQGCLEIEPRLSAYGRMYANDPAVQFAVQSARRNLGDFEAARKWYVDYVATHKDGPWRDAAAAELWLISRSGTPPKPVLPCRLTSSRPLLDGDMSDDCWKGMKPLVLKNAVGETGKEYPTEVRMAYDKEFLYLALRCRHPSGQRVAPVKVRSRDADLRPYDRVSVFLDLDRDYASCYHLQVDQRGCVYDECIVDNKGDPTWNPRWFVAVKSDEESWQIEAAIPMIELTSDSITLGRTWACNVVRTLPGRGVQAWSTPADVTPRLEGMGLLMFTDETRASMKSPAKPAPEKPLSNGDDGR